MHDDVIPRFTGGDRDDNLVSVAAGGDALGTDKNDRAVEPAIGDHDVAATRENQEPFVTYLAISYYLVDFSLAAGLDEAPRRTTKPERREVSQVGSAIAHEATLGAATLRPAAGHDSAATAAASGSREAHCAVSNSASL